MARVIIDRDLCENTGCCEAVCPEDVFEESGGQVTVGHPDKCTSCWICVDNCVSGAVEVD